MSDVKKLYARAYELFKESVECCDNKYEWAASEVFGLVTDEKWRKIDFW